MNRIFEILAHNPAVQTLSKGKGDIIVTSISDEAYAVASAFFASKRNLLVIKQNQYEAQLLYRQLIELDIQDVIYFPVDESQRIEALAQSPELLAERISSLYQLTLDKPKIIVAHTASFIRYLPSVEVFKQHIYHLEVGMRIDLLELKNKLLLSGYQYSSKVDQPFYFSQRGGVIDVYSLQYDNPIRIEFFDDEIESIRFYDGQSQRTIQNVIDVEIIPYLG